MSKNRTLGFILLLACSMVLLFPAPGFAFFDVSSLNDGWIDPYVHLFSFQGIGEDVQFQKKPDFLRIPPTAYWFEFDWLWAKVPGIGGFYIACNMILSAMMILMAGACLIVLTIMDWAFNFTALDGMENYVEHFVRELRDQLFFGELFMVMIFFLGVSLIFSFGRNEDVAGKLLKVIINLIVAFTLLANMGAIIRGINEIGRYGSTAVFTAFSVMPGLEMEEYVKGDPAKNALYNVKEVAFENLVKKPWILANFGKIPRESGPRDDIERQIAEDIKEHLEGNALQQFLVDPLENLGRNLFASFKSVVNTLLPENLEIDEGAGGYGYITMTPLGIPFRFLILLFTYIVGSAIGLLLLAIAGTTIFGKFMLLMLAMLAPLVFLLVLIPDWGDEVLLNWVKGMIAAGTYWIIASLLLVIILFIMFHLYLISGDNWLLCMFLILFFVFSVFRFRTNLYEYLPSQYAVMQAAEQAIFEKVKDTFEEVGEKAIEGGTLIALGGAAVATGNPAMLSGMGRSKMGAAAKGVLEDAANIRRSGAVNGNRPGMTKALRQAIAKQFGFGQHQQSQQQHQQTQRSQTQINRNQSQSHQRVHANQQQDANFVAGMNAATQAVRQFAAALQGVTPRQSETYRQVGNGSVDFRNREYAVFDEKGQRTLSIRNNEVRDAENKVIGTIHNNRVISSDGSRQIGSILQGGQIQVQVPTGQGIQQVGGAIYEVSRATGTTSTTSTKVVEEEIVVRPKVTVADPNPTVQVNPHVTAKESKVNISPEIRVDETQRVDIKPEFNIQDSTVDLDVTTNVNQNNTYIDGGGKGNQSGSSPISPSPTPSSQQPIVNVTVDAGGSKSVTNQFQGDTVHVNANDLESSSGSSGRTTVDMSDMVRLATSASAMTKEQREGALERAKEQQDREERSSEGMLARLIRWFRR